ncbi:thioredoxin family protein [Desmospora activa]|uniref:AhpC/TSA family protein n=1 Tax=Desmospora activa DSM 45169 TaxID=1121389 RepID=A0A2T4ZBW8_9BACL|nr:thioredoxin family protein [Desmospora activa]PTM59362.1 AhpC/TSA family protein [Desmospora activa DSM 45169]
MARTESNMIPLGSPAPLFSLPDAVSGKIDSLDELKSDKATVIMFICNHCPFVKHVQAQLVQVAQDYQAKGVTFIAINANDAETYPDDSPENMKEVAAEAGYPFPYLFDESQEVAKAYQAACTPDFFVFDGELKLAYRGQLDDSRPQNGIPVTGESLRAALDLLLQGKPVPPEQKPSIGCNIKWKPE